MFNVLILFSFSPVDGHILVATVLLKNGAYVNATTNEGKTPLSLAQLTGHAHGRVAHGQWRQVIILTLVIDLFLKAYHYSFFEK